MQAQQALCVLQQDLACGSEANGFPGTIKKALLIFFFEQANLGADSRLRAKYLSGSAREIPFLRDFDKRLQVIQVHVWLRAPVAICFLTDYILSAPLLLIRKINLLH